MDPLIILYHSENFHSSPYSRSAKQQLRVYCAGVWHNTVLALFAWFMLVISAPIFSLVYETNSGVVVVDVKQNGFISGDQ